jgi:hypothetical protein
MGDKTASTDAALAGRPGGRIVGVYIAMFAALGLVWLGCWKWPVFAELWYCHRYEKTQDAVWREKLEALGERHPELMLSRWFHLVEGYGSPEELAGIPLSIRQKGVGLYLGERLKGDWWKEKCYSKYPSFPWPKRDEWEPHRRLPEAARSGRRGCRSPFQGIG